MVNVSTSKVTRLTTVAGSWTLEDVFHDYILVSVSTVNTTSRLVSDVIHRHEICQLCYVFTFLMILYDCFGPTVKSHYVFLKYFSFCGHWSQES